MVDRSDTESALAQVVADPRGVVEEASPEGDRSQGLSPADVRHNMIVLIMLETIFNTGAADLALVTTPLYVFLKASNTTVGLVGSLSAMALIGVILSPFISVRFRRKKWYLFVSHLPYIGAWGILGLGLIFSEQMGIPKSSILAFVIVMTAANWFFGGFVSLPHQEYTAACIPMSHRGRYNGYSLSLGALASMSSNALGGVVLYYVAKPMAYGYLYLMAWFFCQFGYLFSLLGRELPTPVEKAPRPWSKNMVKAVWHDRAFLRVVVLYYQVYQTLYPPLFMTYVALYALRELKLIPASVAVIAGVMLVARMSTSLLIGHLTDRVSPKRVLPFYPLLGLLAFVPLLCLHNQWGIYISVAIGSAFMVGYQNAFAALAWGIPSPENRSGHYTVQVLLMNLSFAVGPFLLGVMCDVLSYRLMFAIVGLATLALAPVTKYYLSILSSDPRAYS